jgi:hypothetical protein
MDILGSFRLTTRCQFSDDGSDNDVQAESVQ